MSLCQIQPGVFPANDLPQFVPGGRPCWSHLASAEEMRVWDERAQKDFGIPVSLLMENAAREALHVIMELFDRSCGCSCGCSDDPRNGADKLRDKRILLFAGPGNNGGDAIALARNLKDAGCRVLLVHTKPLSNLKGASAEHMRMARKAGVSFMPARRWLDSANRRLPWPDPTESDCACEEIPCPDMMVDGLLGTGFTAPLDEMMIALVEKINRLRCLAPVIALDSPTGLDKDGLPAPVAVMAHHTIAFQTSKMRLLLPAAVQYVGQAHVRSVGIPAALQESAPTSTRLLEPGCLDALPRLDPSLHKAKAGRVLVIGGSQGLTGAPILAALGALRGGAGLVTIACPAGLALEIKAGNPDIMTLPVGTGTEWDARFMPILLAHARNCDAIVLGPGMGRSAGAVMMVRAFLQHTQDVPAARAPAVIDADAIFALAVGENPLALPTSADILTPHPLEMARLLEGKAEANADAVLNDRAGALTAFTKICKSAVNLKGACSLITQAGHAIHVSPFVAPCLAVGGSGDVLSGLMAALLAQRVPPLAAAALGVYWHGNAGVMLEEEFPQRGNTARDIANILPHARLCFAGHQSPDDAKGDCLC